MKGSLDSRLAFLATAGLCGAVMFGSLYATSQSPSALPAETDPTSVSPGAAFPVAAMGGVDEAQLFSTAGFRLTLPAGWSVQSETDGVVDIEGEGSRLTVRIGEPDGRLQTCETPARAWERCRDVVITTLDEFADAVRMGPVEGCTGLCGPLPAGGRPDRLDGEDALRVRISGYEHLGRGGENALYVLAIHDGRPFFLRFHTSANFAPGSPPGALWDEILASFKFERPAASTDQTPSLETRVFARAGFQITLPGSWPVRRDSGHSVEIVGGGRSLSIWVGDADGWLHKTCGIDDSGPSGPIVLEARRYWERCEDATIHVLDDFAQLFREPWADAVSQTSAAGCATPCPPLSNVARPSSLGGEPAAWIRINGYRYLFALHDRRPYFLRFGPAIAFQPSAPKATLESAVDTFEFIDEGTVETPSPTPPEPSQPAFQTISWAEAAVEFDVPGSWERRPESDPLVLSVAGRGGRLTLRIGDSEGRILNCGDASGTPCTMIGIESLEELTDLVAPEHSAYWGPGATKVSTRTIPLDAEMANRVIIEQWPGRQYGGRVRYYVVAIHGGRPLIAAWAPTGGGGPIFRGILDSFRFVD